MQKRQSFADFIKYNKYGVIGIVVSAFCTMATIKLAHILKTGLSPHKTFELYKLFYFSIFATIVWPILGMMFDVTGLTQSERSKRKNPFYVHAYRQHGIMSTVEHILGKLLAAN